MTKKKETEPTQEGEQDLVEGSSEDKQTESIEIPEGDYGIVWARPSGLEITTKATRAMIDHAEANGWTPVREAE